MAASIERSLSPTKTAIATLLVLLGTSCDEPPSTAAPSAAARAAPSARASGPAAAPAPTQHPRPSAEEEVETVDDTIPPDDIDDGEAGAPADACAPKTPGLKPMQLLRFTFSDGVEGKDPKSKLAVAKAGQRVYAHLAMRNRSGRKRCLHLTFRVGGKKRTAVTVEIGKSWEWRTYAYNTLRADDNKPLELTVTDDQGALVLKKLLAVIPRKQ